MTVIVMVERLECVGISRVENPEDSFDKKRLLPN